MKWLNICSETGQPVSRQPNALKTSTNSGWALESSFQDWYKQNLDVDISSGWVTHPTSAGYAFGYRGSAQQIAKSFNRKMKSGDLDHIVPRMPVECGGTIFAAPIEELAEEGTKCRERRYAGLKRGLDD